MQKKVLAVSAVVSVATIPAAAMAELSADVGDGLETDLYFGYSGSDDPLAAPSLQENSPGPGVAPAQSALVLA